MAFVERTPIVVGVGDVKNKSLQVKDAIEPMQLMLQAIYCALEDVSSVASVKSILQSHIDSVSVVATWTWPYADLPGLLSKKLEVDPKHRLYSPHGGNQPAKLFDEAARRIARGESRVALVTGGEALASRKHHIRRDGREPPLLMPTFVGSQCMHSYEDIAAWLDKPRLACEICKSSEARVIRRQ